MIKMIQITWNSQPQKAVNPTGSPTSPVFNSNSMKCSMKLHLYATIFDASNENQASSNCFFSPSLLKNSKFFNKHAKNRLIQSSIILILTWRCQTVSIQKNQHNRLKMETTPAWLRWRGVGGAGGAAVDCWLVCETRIWVKMMFI